MDGKFGDNGGKFSFQPSSKCFDLAKGIQQFHLDNLEDEGEGTMQSEEYYLLSAYGSGGDRHCGARVSLGLGTLKELFSSIQDNDFTINFLGEEVDMEYVLSLKIGSETYTITAKHLIQAFRRLLGTYGGTLTISVTEENNNNLLVFSKTVPLFSMEYYYGELKWDYK